MKWGEWIASLALGTCPFDYLEENVQRFLIPERPQEDFEAAWLEARKLPMPIEAANSFLPANIPMVATSSQSVDTQRLERYVKTALERAEQVGIRVIVFGSGAARACPPGYSRADAIQQIGEHLSRWSDWAQNHGVMIVLLRPSLLSHVHVAEKQERAAPGRCGEDFRPSFSALHQAGYDRRISIECNWQNFATEVGPAIETLKEQWMISAG